MTYKIHTQKGVLFVDAPSLKEAIRLAKKGK